MTYRSVMDLTNLELLAERAVPEHEVSDAVFVEGAWWRAQRIWHRNGRWLSSEAVFGVVLTLIEEL